MADTRVQLEVEDWVRREWMPRQFNERFSRERVRLAPGGMFEFDALNSDFSVIATISTSCARTAAGKRAVGKLMKLRADMYFLLLADVKRRYLIFTDQTMFTQCEKERASGRVPASIEFFHAPLPPELAGRLAASQRVASEEVRPRNDP